MLLATSTVVALALAEALLRILPDPNAANRYRAHAKWHHWLRPNQRASLPSLDPKRWPKPIELATNSWGCRYGELEGERKGSRGEGQQHRILVIGDSFTEGYYLEDTFAAVLERRTGHQVIGCGNSSYSPLLHYIRYRDQLSKLQPDELIINVDLTDIYDDNWRYGPEAVFAADGEPLRASNSRLSILADDLRFRSRLAALIVGRFRQDLKLPISLNVYAYHRGMVLDDPQFKQEVGRTLSYLKRLVDLAKSQGVSVTITTYPYLNQLRDRVHGDRQWNRNLEVALAFFAGREGVPFWSAFKALEPHADSIYWEFDVHFTPSGQLIWAEAFADYYLSR